MLVMKEISFSILMGSVTTSIFVLNKDKAILKGLCMYESFSENLSQTLLRGSWNRKIKANWLLANPNFLKI